ncbi:MAG: DUF559 domain-containing protein [Nanoarchaeota archaeon]
MGYFCNSCNKTITKAVYTYSYKNFDKALCREHQPNNIREPKNVYGKEPKKEAKFLGSLLKDNGWNVEFEKWDGYKHVDIVIENAKVHIEIDGSHHNLKLGQAIIDLQRTYHSFKKGYVTLRIPNCLVKNKDLIFKTAHYINTFLKQGFEMNNKVDDRNLFERIIGKKIEFV